MSTEVFVGMLALVGVVIVAAALMSGWLERTNLPQVAIFLLLGTLAGPHCLGLMDIGIDSPALRVVGTLALALVLFTDAVTLSFRDVRKHARLATLILGPGTLIAVGLMTILAVYLLRLSWIEAIIVASALGSTDPVMLRGLLRRKNLTESSRVALRLESGLNDVVLLPILLIAMEFLIQKPGEQTELARILLDLFVLGPIAGIVVGYIAIVALRFARERIGVRRDYESIYSLGVCFAAFAAAESVHGSGFLACFAAGMVISILDEELCDCFVEYGETTAELLLLFTFVLLGSSLIWSGISTLSLALAIFAVLCLFTRPIGLLISLAREPMDRDSRWLVAWFGPRGLSSLLLILLPAFAGMPGSTRMLEICSIVVLLSVLVHGGSIFALGRRKPSESLTTLRQTGSAGDPNLIRTIDFAKERERGGEEIWWVDVRSRKSFEASNEVLLRTVRIDPDECVESAERAGIPKDAWVALFCT